VSARCYNRGNREDHRNICGDGVMRYLEPMFKRVIARQLVVYHRNLRHNVDSG
jgi:hypothetical protein